jgi:hypothetical protein
MSVNKNDFEFIPNFQSPFREDWGNQEVDRAERGVSRKIGNLNLDYPQKILVAVIFFKTREPERLPFSSVLNSEDLAILANIANTNLLYQFNFELLGYADSRGDRYGNTNFNIELSERRALSVSEILFQQRFTRHQTLKPNYVIIPKGVDKHATSGDNPNARRVEIWAQPISFSNGHQNSNTYKTSECNTILYDKLNTLKTNLQKRKLRPQDVIKETNTLLNLYVLALKYNQLHNDGVQVSSHVAHRLGIEATQLEKLWKQSDCAIFEHLLNRKASGLEALLGGKPNQFRTSQIFPNESRLNHLINLVSDKTRINYEVTIRRQMFIRNSDDEWLKWIELFADRYKAKFNTLNPWIKIEGLPDWNELTDYYKKYWKKYENQFTGNTLYSELAPRYLDDGSPCPTGYMSDSEHRGYLISEFRELDNYINFANSKVLNREFSILSNGKIQ